MANEYVKLWCSYEAYFEPLSAAEVGRLALAMMKYKSQGAEPVFNGNERFVWPAIRRDIDAQNQAQESIAEKNRENGTLGGRPKKAKKPSRFFENPDEPKIRQGQGQGQGQGKGQGDIKEKDIPSGISKKKFGEYDNVRLTDDERRRLDEQLGDAGAREYIDRLSGYLASKGDHYKDHFATIRNWWRKDGSPVKRSAAGKEEPAREITADMSVEEILTGF